MSGLLSSEYEIKAMRLDEHSLLEDFLYEAIFVSPDFKGEVPRSIIYDDPMCRAAFEEFGLREDDIALVATIGDKPIGACWVRTTNEYGHIDDRTPSFSISLHEPYRGNGIGTALITAMLEELRSREFGRASLSAQKENPAAGLYQRLGFEIIGDEADESEWLMVIDPSQCRRQVVAVGLLVMMLPSSRKNALPQSEPTRLMFSLLAKAHSMKPMLKTVRKNRKTYHSKCGDDDIGRNIPNTYGVFSVNHQV